MTATAAAILIGNELLSGKIADKNLVVLAKTLRELGVRLARVSMVPDDVELIATEVRTLAQTHSWVFTSGGVGPTHDDVTVEAVARAFEQQVVVHPELATMIEGVYGESLREGHLLMARVPERARLVRSEVVPWPAVVCENVMLLPGVPEIFSMKMKLVASIVEPARPFITLAVNVNVDEGTLKPALDETVELFPDVEIGSYPTFRDPVVRTKLTFDGTQRAQCEAARDAFIERLGSEAVVGLEG